MAQKNKPEETFSVEDLKNDDFKKKFLDGLQKLGFPLEIKVRNLLTDIGFIRVKPTYFTVKRGFGDIRKSLDFQASDLKSKKILDEVNLNFDILLLGECKYTSDKSRFLFAVPVDESSEDKFFICPIITLFQKANSGAYRNTQVMSSFFEKYGRIYIASDIKDTSKNHIISGKEGDKDKQTPDYEKIYNICEDQLMPALNTRYNETIFSFLTDYSPIDSYRNGYNQLSIEVMKEILSGHDFTTKIIIPIIITSKIIVAPTIQDGKIVDIQSQNLILYLHSSEEIDKFPLRVADVNEIGVFICNEQSISELIKYIRNMRDKLMEIISNSLELHPKKFFEDYSSLLKELTYP